MYFENEEFLTDEDYTRAGIEKEDDKEVVLKPVIDEPEYRMYKGKVKVKLSERHDGVRWVWRNFSFHARDIAEAWRKFDLLFQGKVTWWKDKYNTTPFSAQ